MGQAATLMSDEPGCSRRPSQAPADLVGVGTNDCQASHDTIRLASRYSKVRRDGYRAVVGLAVDAIAPSSSGRSLARSRPSWRDVAP